MCETRPVNRPKSKQQTRQCIREAIPNHLLHVTPKMHKRRRMWPEKVTFKLFCLQVILIELWMYPSINCARLNCFKTVRYCGHNLQMIYVYVGTGTGRRDDAATSPTRELSVFSKRTIAGGLTNGQGCDMNMSLCKCSWFWTVVSSYGYSDLWISSIFKRKVFN